MPAPRVYTIPLHQPFADALAAGLMARTRGDRLALARATVLVPNNRARRSINDAFVRRSERGLLLPRLVSIGDPELGDRIGLALDPADNADLPAAIDPITRQLILARLVSESRRARGEPIDAGEALRLARDLARTLDQLIVEDVEPARLADTVPPELAGHWQSSLDLLRIVLTRWPEALHARGLIDGAARRNRLMDAAERRWAETPPGELVVAAGFSVAAPALARLLRRIARLPQGMLVLPGVDVGMDAREWDLIAGTEEGVRPIETHPQFGLAQLLDRIGVARAEVRRWPRGGGTTTAPARTVAVNQAMAPAFASDRWAILPARARRLSAVRALELANPAAEAQAVALAIREAVETPGRTVALITPDRGLAARVAAHLARWNIAADDSAGRPLSRTPPGTLLLALADAAAEEFAPVPLLALLKHPLVATGARRLAWLDGARRLDRALRGPRPAPGLDGVTRFLAQGDGYSARDREAARAWWGEVCVLLAPLEQAFAEANPAIPALVAALREAAAALAGDAAWGRHDGQAAAALLAALEENGGEGPAVEGARGFPDLLRTFLEAEAVRPPQGGHNRVFIWGLIEARLQQVDLAILGGLNEGVWPSLPAPDPWLAPAIRQALGLPGLERRIGVEAQQFAAALGAREVLVTRARRDARAPAVASRFWLRLQAMTGGLAPARHLAVWSDVIDSPAGFAPAVRPRPRPPVEDRPRRIAVTKLDRLRADPFAFYADAMLKLRALDQVDADPSAAWRGSAVHAVFEAWIRLDACDPACLRPRAEALLAETAAHPVLRALWAPRLLEAIDWVAAEVAADLAEERQPIAAEMKGRIDVAGVTLEGTVDRIDRLADRSFAIVDWKTGKPPSKKAVAEGYSMQLGLLGLIAERGGFGSDLIGRPTAFEYWSLAAGKDGTLGYRTSPVGLDKKGEGIDPLDFPARAARVLENAVANYLAGSEPFVAKLHPEYAPYGDYDQLMRLDEWYGRAGVEGEGA